MDSILIQTPIGNVLAQADDKALYSLDFTNSDASQTNSKNPLLLQLKTELKGYFEGKRKKFTVPLAPLGTPFQTSVWNTLCRIPYGETISYATEAEMLGRPTAVRAVANANGKNPISILIPCHRVIASNGGIGGYSGGIWRKEFLLKLES